MRNYKYSRKIGFINLKFSCSATIVLRSGKGGNGIISWRRESKVKWGGPDGGSGGKGGSIYIETDENLNSLFHIRHIKFLKAKNGEDGKNKSRQGSDAEDIFVKVPPGTNIFDKSTGIKICECMKHGEKFLICKGGKGGRGNVAFKSSRKPTPYMYEFGDPSEEKTIFMDLQIIAEIGLLGKPNAGKSSLLNEISNAKPKIESFPFTTLIPVLGTVNHNNKKIIFADIPGLIEGSSQGAGLGIEFLKHINRCRCLIHVVDSSKKDVIKEIQDIEKEIFNYSENLYKKPKLLALNKIDLINQEQLQFIIKDIKTNLGVNPIPISSLHGTGIYELLDKAFDMFQKNVESNQKCIINKPKYLEIHDSENMKEVEIRYEEGTWYITHPELKYWSYKIPKDTNDNISRFIQKLEQFKINQILAQKGAQKGEMIDIYGWQYDFLGIE